MTDEEKIKIKRVLFSAITSIITIPIWWFLFNLIFAPKNYISDGPTDFGYGFMFFFIMPLLWGLSLISLLILSKKIFKKKE